MHRCHTATVVSSDSMSDCQSVTSVMRSRLHVATAAGLLFNGSTLS